jgi:hypothetical protein
MVLGRLRRSAPVNAPLVNGTVKILNRLFESRLNDYSPRGSHPPEASESGQEAADLAIWTGSARALHHTFTPHLTSMLRLQSPLTAFDLSSSPDNLRFSPAIPIGGWPYRTAHEVPIPRSPKPCRLVNMGLGQSPVNSASSRSLLTPQPK